MKIIAAFLVLSLLNLPASFSRLITTPENEITALQAAAESTDSAAFSAELERLDNTKKGWGQGKQVDDVNRPVSCTEFQNKYGKYDAIFIKDNAKQIYLTFDEGYENGYTSKILDVLKEKNVTAVFFVTYDYAKRNPELVQRMIGEGHVVGNHSYTHPSMPTLSLAKASDEITALHNYVKENFNYTMTLFRPPMGEFSERTLALTQSLGYKSVFWSFAYVDWDTSKQMGSDKAYTKVVGGLHNGAVYLLHAVSKDNAEILGSFIDEAGKKGYVFAKLS
ncbi:peptidoglycan-N-acetylmuramic acid deacetylase [Sporobacter termitidis DSM 10068]|uniref:Peptidoglycan-N-acetylmuramic acid deacetylase n=1 Tax=Sporobacter termitidis DSM 10068 TaxID=1123282 RepID=A0A1M5ZFE1_9FIRM|nr:polysaccharide deacetylase family protein [Sporobacter termitidis]SHI22960.1 peptidoglycan-N-acetylmuramic acid deacetylase [Sporobacter termitidis DSM 10068]